MRKIESDLSEERKGNNDRGEDMPIGTIIGAIVNTITAILEVITENFIVAMGIIGTIAGYYFVGGIDGIVVGGVIGGVLGMILSK